MPASIKIINGTGVIYDFSDPAKGELPLISRRAEIHRRSNQGPGTRQINVQISGFHEGNDHAEITLKHMDLVNFLRTNDVSLIYNDGVRDIINRSRCYIDSVSEPEEWKQYSGDYQITLHYFEPWITDQSGTTAPVNCSFMSAFTTYDFNPAPHWGISCHPVRQNFRGPRYLPSGGIISEEHHVTLQGTLFGDGVADLMDKLTVLYNAFSDDGILNYGAWTSNVRIVSCDIPATFPSDHADYSITFAYNTNDAHQYQSSISFSRIHQYPKIRERIFCGRRKIQLFGPSGQFVSYNLKMWSSSVGAARIALAQQTSYLVYPNGIEMPGGSETPDNSDNSVAVQFTKYHDTPVLDNLAGT